MCKLRVAHGHICTHTHTRVASSSFRFQLIRLNYLNTHSICYNTLFRMSLYAQASTILTEHLGYNPIALIDDVVNAVNDIMYKCTAAMESFLRARYGQDPRVPADEIEHGTSKLEMLLESVVDKSFDKFELYVLRNLLTFPADLISGGWIRLKHHMRVDFTTKDPSSVDERIAELERQIYIQERLNSVLVREVQAKRQLCDKISQIHETAEFLSPDANPVLLAISPLPDTVSDLSSRASHAISSVSSTESLLTEAPLKPYLDILPRDAYINAFTYRIIQDQGIPATIEGPKAGSLENLSSIAGLVKRVE